jgi:hypothetical protein
MPIHRDLVFVAALGATACAPEPNDVVENESDSAGEGGGGVVELEPEGDPEVGPPIFEISVDAQIEPEYDPFAGHEIAGDTLRLWHCGATIVHLEDGVHVPADTVEVSDIGAVVHVDYPAYLDYRIFLGSGGSTSLSLVFDADGAPIYSESPEWNGGEQSMGTFVRALDIETPLFRLDTAPTPTITVLDPMAEYDQQTGELAVTYDFATTANETFTVTESYSFSGFHAPTVTTPPVGCD